MQTDPETQAATVAAMTPVELIDRLQAVTNHFIAAANAAQTTFGRDLQAVLEDLACKALGVAQPHLLKAIIDAEMKRMAEALPQ